jgi:hypothetical protein|tara:strand:+ start:1937 stop:2563 length:627 start_codon:yes stop_codon:yes gene_type:complete
MITPYDIYQYGDFYRIHHNIDTSKILDTLELFESKWSQYNTRRSHIPREGLCVFNYDGVCGPNPALDSLKQYNELHSTNLTESDANVPTELYNASPELQEYFKPLIGSVVRTHFLKLKPGGFFPPHRDHTKGKQNSFRIIVPIINCEVPCSNFILEDKILNMNCGSSYIINTTKMHTLFNADAHRDSIWLVINAKIDERSLKFIESGL